MSDYDVKRNSIYINYNFETLAGSVIELETSGRSLYGSIQIIKDIEIKTKSVGD